MYKHMLIDGRNALYRAIYAGIHDKRFIESGDDYFLIFLKFINHYCSSFKPKHIHLFWDDRRDKLWRTTIYPQYKGNRASVPEVDVILKRQITVALDVCRSLGFTQYFRETQEADDLIYAFCRSTTDKTIIISSDGDMKQIIYHMPHVDLYNPLSKERRINRTVAVDEKPEVDPIVFKSMVGDKSDNIDGYHNVGAVRGRQYTIDLLARLEFFKSEKSIIAEGAEPIGDKQYKRNRLLVDLGLNPHLLDNMLYVERQMGSLPQFAYKDAITKLRKRQVSGVIELADKYVVPFANLST